VFRVPMKNDKRGMMQREKQIPPPQAAEDRTPRVGMTVAMFFAAVLTCGGLCAAAAFGQVTSQRLLESAKEPQNWMMYSGDYAGHRYSGLEQINTGNAHSLAPKWAYQTMAGGKFETTPLVVDGVLYGTGQDDRAYALDARSGRPIWQYQQTLPVNIRPCCGRANRGVAILGVKLFVATMGAHVVMLDSKTGSIV